MDLKTLQIVCQVLLCCFSGIYNIPVEDFYEFGASNNDTKYPNVDDYSIMVPISANFPYFGYDHAHVYVNANGGISTEADTSYGNYDFDNNKRKILPFYVDIDIRKGGEIWYRQTTDTVQLQRATSEIRSAFPQHSSFTATWMFLSTWYNVNSNDNEPLKRNTFQAVLVTDEVTSFIIFLYANTEWTRTIGLFASIAMAGYFSGDGVNNLLFPESWNTTELITLSEKTNVGIPGMFIFDVGGPTVAAGPCPGGIVTTNGLVEYIEHEDGTYPLRFICDNGFELVGNGRWYDSTALCEEMHVSCPLQEINHGFVTGDNNYGDSITYVCDTGYTLVCGDEVMSCGSDGLWDGIIPSCISITNGSVEYSAADGDSDGTINTTCDEGFNLVGEEAVVCDLDGTWGDSLPVCEEITCPLQEINHGFVTGENNYGDSITFGCEPGYTLACGDEVMSCGIDGLWDGISPFCIWRGNSNAPVRDVDAFCSKLRENNGEFGQRPQ